MPVDHTEAADQQLADRYLLGEMSAAGAAEFEEHFFECEECAAAVEAGQMLLANGRELMRAEPDLIRADLASAGDAGRARPTSLWEKLTSWWKRPLVMLPAAAAVLLAGLAVYQNAIEIPALRGARVVPAFELIGASRGDASAINIPRTADSFVLSADIPPDVHFARYACELTSDGATVFRLDTPPPATGQPVTILIPAHDIKAGPFELTISGIGEDGKKREKVASFSFDLRFLH